MYPEISVLIIHFCPIISSLSETSQQADNFRLINTSMTQFHEVWMIPEGTTGTATQSHESLPRGGMLTSFLWYLGFAVIKSFHVKEGAHFKSQLQRKVQLSSAPRGEERKAKISYSPYNKTIKQDYLKNHTNNSNVHCSRDYHFFNLLFFHKTPQPPKSVPLSSAYHSDPF